jgi:hypothetical protein
MNATLPDDLLLSVDPGLTSTGWAAWNRGVLISCGLVRSYERTPLQRAEETVHALQRLLPYGETVELVIEKPRVYQQRKQKGDPNDLLDIALVIGVIVKGVPHHNVIAVEPRTWKGTIRKPRHLEAYVVHTRLMTSLSEGELAQYVKGLQRCSPSLRHNVADAVGIGAWRIRQRGQY